MQDGVGAAQPTARNDGLTKRRRLGVPNDIPTSTHTPGPVPDVYTRWDDTSHEQSYPGSANNAASYPDSATMDFIRQPNRPPELTPGDTSNWQNASQSGPYPDLGSFQQQPYFYHNADAATHPNGVWPAYTSDPSALRQAHQTEAVPFYPPIPSTGLTTLPISSSHGPAAYANVDTAPRFDYRQSAGFTSTPAPPLMLSQPREPAYSTDDASTQMKIQSLPILDNLATQLIQTISKASYLQIRELMSSDSDAEDCQAYQTLKNLFDQTRKVYSRETPFIDAIAIQMFQQSQQEIIRKANIATFISSILGAHDVSFFHLNEFFMETFVPLGHRLLKWQGAIFLELKTQVYISALINSDGTPEDMLDELFPADLDAQILTRHPDAPSLSPSEQDFIDRSRARKSYLAEPSSGDSVKDLPKKYQWTDFVREFASCISKNIDGVMSIPARASSGLGGPQGSKTSMDTASGLGAATGGVTGLTLGSGSGGHSSNSSVAGGGAAGLHADGSSGGDARRSTTLSTTASSAPPTTMRQPWTKPEEDALLAGLERVNGPHWSQILALYGRGGSVSEVLKDRNQVQLKDKARNLKLWYLKTGKELPASLKGVTGELRKRGGARARAALGVAEEDEAGGAAAELKREGEGEEGEKGGGKGGRKRAGKKK